MCFVFVFTFYIHIFHNPFWQYDKLLRHLKVGLEVGAYLGIKMENPIYFFQIFFTIDNVSWKWDQEKVD
jgi:hypothetical protein